MFTKEVITREKIQTEKITYEQMNKIASFIPFMHGKETNKPDIEKATLISVYSPEEWTDNTKSQIDYNYNFITLTIKIEGEPKIRNQIIHTDDLYIYDPYDDGINEYLQTEISIYRIAGLKGWEIWITPTEMSYNDLCNYMDHLY